MAGEAGGSGRVFLVQSDIGQLVHSCRAKSLVSDAASQSPSPRWAPRVSQWQRLSVKKQAGGTGGGWVASAVAAAGEGGRGEEAAGISWRSSWFSTRTRSCSVLWSRTSKRPASLAQSGVGLVAPFSALIKLLALSVGNPGHYFYELLFWQTPALVSCDSLEEFLVVFYVKVHTNPEVDSLFALGNLDFNEPFACDSHCLGCVSGRFLSEFSRLFPRADRLRS